MRIHKRLIDLTSSADVVKQIVSGVSGFQPLVCNFASRVCPCSAPIAILYM